MLRAAIESRTCRLSSIRIYQRDRWCGVHARRSSAAMASRVSLRVVPLGATPSSPAANAAALPRRALATSSLEMGESPRALPVSAVPRRIVARPTNTTSAHVETTERVPRRTRSRPARRRRRPGSPRAPTGRRPSPPGRRLLVRRAWARSPVASDRTGRCRAGRGEGRGKTRERLDEAHERGRLPHGSDVIEHARDDDGSTAASPRPDTLR